MTLECGSLQALTEVILWLQVRTISSRMFTLNGILYLIFSFTMLSIAHPLDRRCVVILLGDPDYFTVGSLSAPPHKKRWWHKTMSFAFTLWLFWHKTMFLLWLLPFAFILCIAGLLSGGMVDRHLVFNSVRVHVKKAFSIYTDIATCNAFSLLSIWQLICKCHRYDASPFATIGRVAGSSTFSRNYSPPPVMGEEENVQTNDSNILSSTTVKKNLLVFSSETAMAATFVRSLNTVE